jgi:uncharacterized delta-60 repeat protein
MTPVRTLTACAFLAASCAQAQSIDAYAPQPLGTVTTAAMQADGKTLLGGPFLFIDSIARTRVARLNVDGSVDMTFNDPVVNSEVKTIAVQPDGKILIGGSFDNVGGQTRHYLARLNDDGSLDTSFADPALDDAVWSIAIQPDGRILAGGDFTHIGGTARNYAARFDANGSFDTSFGDPQLCCLPVRAVVLQPDGRVVIGGVFSQAGGVNDHFYLARYSSSGVFDPSFPNVPDSVVLLANDIVIAPDGSLFLSGSGDPAIRKLNADGTLDSGFNAPGTDGEAYGMVLQPDGKLLIAGTFEQVDGQPHANVARLDADGSLDATFASVPFRATADNPNAYAYGLSMQADDAVVVFGNFTLVGATPRQYVARIGATTHAGDRFSGVPSGSSVQATWQRSGGGEELAQPPVLQYSTDAVHYTDVGAMTRVTGGWSGTAPHDVHGSVFWLRALGTYSSGAGNGSRSQVASPAWLSDTVFADGFD